MKRIAYLLILSLTALGCKKEGVDSSLEGNYTGSFRTIVNGKMVKSDFDVTLNRKKFAVVNGEKKASGTFNLISNHEVNFTDKNYWTADFDMNLVLNGDYLYEIKGDSLILTKSFPAMPYSLFMYNYYQYRLKRN